MPTYLIMLLFRVCALVIPLVALHRFWIADVPGYSESETRGYRGGTLLAGDQAVFSLEWQVKLAKLEVQAVQAEIAKVTAELELARANQSLSNSGVKPSP